MSAEADGLLAAFPLVIALLFRRGPSTIVRIIVAIVVDAVNGHANWLRPHVRKKVAKVRPSLTYRYSASSVAIISGASRVEAPLPHGTPCLVFACRGVAGRIAVFDAPI